MDELQDLKPFEQKPYWDPNAEFTFSGIEFEHLFKTLQPWMGIAFIMQGIMEKHIQNGTIKVKYEYTDGSGELSEDEVKNYTEIFLKQLKQQEAERPQVVETPAKPKKTKIIVP